MGSSRTRVLCFLHNLFSPHSLKNAQILMNVLFFVVSKIETSTRGTFSSIAREI